MPSLSFGHDSEVSSSSKSPLKRRHPLVPCHLDGQTGPIAGCGTEESRSTSILTKSLDELTATILWPRGWNNLDIGRLRPGFRNASTFRTPSLNAFFDRSRPWGTPKTAVESVNAWRGCLLGGTIQGKAAVPNTKPSPACAARRFREPSPQPQSFVPRKQPPRAKTEKALGEEVLSCFNSGAAAGKQAKQGSDVGHAQQRNQAESTPGYNDIGAAPAKVWAYMAQRRGLHPPDAKPSRAAW